MREDCDDDAIDEDVATLDDVREDCDDDVIEEGGAADETGVADPVGTALLEVRGTCEDAVRTLDELDDSGAAEAGYVNVRVADIW